MTTATIPMPQAVSGLDMAFPTNVSHLMPKYDEIPKEFKNPNVRNKWTQFQSDWFYCGFRKLEVTPKDGIDKDAALRHLKCIQGSFEPKHEHKSAAVAYLASLWFDDVKYDKAKG